MTSIRGYIISFIPRFLNQLLSLLSDQPEKLDASVVRHIKEILSHELNTALRPCLFEEIRFYIERFFDSHGQVQSKHNFDLNSEV